MELAGVSMAVVPPSDELGTAEIADVSVTACLADALGMPDPTAIRLRVAIARTGRDCGDRLVADLCRFADARAEDLDDAHPILRLAACVAALRDGQ